MDGCSEHSRLVDSVLIVSGVISLSSIRSMTRNQWIESPVRILCDVFGTELYSFCSLFLFDTHCLSLL